MKALRISLIAVFLFSLTSLLNAQTTTSTSTTTTIPSLYAPASALNDWLPVVVIGVLASVSLVTIYYLIGAILNNRRVKAAAINEYGNAIGTIVIMVIILAVITYFGSASNYYISQDTNTQLNNICNTLNGGNIDLIKTTSSSSTSTPSNPTDDVCRNVISVAGSGSTDITTNIDYGLASTLVVISNLTNQTLRNMNALYLFDSFTGFLATLKIGASVCLPEEACLYKLPGALSVTAGYAPFEGYNLLIGGVKTPLITQATIIFYMYMIQIIVTALILAGWPYMLAAGLVLRTTFFTRRIGGLLIAIVIGALLLYPILFMFEYVALSSTTLSPIGANPANTVTPGTGSAGSIGYQTYLNSNLIIHAYPPNARQLYTSSGTDPISVELKNQNGFTCTDAQLFGIITGSSGTGTDPCFENGYPSMLAAWLKNPISPVPLQVSSEFLISKFNSYGLGNINFFVYPRADYVVNYYGCWPTPFFGAQSATSTSYLLTQQELKIGLSYYTPAYGLFLAIKDLIGSFVNDFPTGPAGFYCYPQNVVSATITLEQLYGYMSVMAIVLPILNLLIVLSGIRGLSGLLGGESDLLGIGKFL